MMTRREYKIFEFLIWRIEEALSKKQTLYDLNFLTERIRLTCLQALLECKGQQELAIFRTLILTIQIKFPHLTYTHLKFWIQERDYYVTPSDMSQSRSQSLSIPQSSI
jgi:hypothetical protein